MTLTDFKKTVKITSLACFLFLWGAASFVAGKFSSTQAPNGKVQGESREPSHNDKREYPIPSEDIQTWNVLGATAKFCSNTQFKYQLTYPTDWFTTYSNPNDECAYFAPFTFVVPSIINDNIVPISVTRADPSTWEQTIAFFENPNDFQNVLSSQNLEINTHAVKKIEAISTDKDTLKKGFLKISYLIFDSTNPLIFTYTQLSQDENTDNMKLNLDEMVKSLKFY